ncbi:MAG: ACP S-malonyltransferase [Fibrobacterota bacterium]
MSYAFLYPGQGAQETGMGKGFFDTGDRAKELFEQAESILGYDLRNIVFEDPDGILGETQYTQPALFTVEAIITDVLKERGIAPTVTMGHSLGEYSALYGAEVFSFEEGLGLVSARGRFMAEAGRESRGAMAAVIGLEKEILEKCLREVTAGTVVSANINSPSQIVISGEKPAVDEACEKLEAAGAKRVVPLKVSGAFHSPLMKPAAEKLQKVLDDVSFKRPVCPVITNVTATGIEDPLRLKELLVQQLLSPVRWVESEEELARYGVETLLEVGPGKVIKGLLRAWDRKFKALSCGTPEGLEKIF